MIIYGTALLAVSYLLGVSGRAASMEADSRATVLYVDDEELARKYFAHLAAARYRVPAPTSPAGAVLFIYNSHHYSTPYRSVEGNSTSSFAYISTPSIATSSWRINSLRAE